MRPCSICIFFTLVFIASCDNSPRHERVDEELTITTSDSTELFVKKAGLGPACIFVHGGPGAWSKSFEMMGGNALEEHFTMIYYDQRGSGRSGNAADYGLDRMVDDIDEIRKHSKAEKVFLIAHSFGGVVATNYAAKYPENIHGLILANSTLHLEQSLLAQIEYINRLTGEHTEPIGGDSSLIQFGAARGKLQA